MIVVLTASIDSSASFVERSRILHRFEVAGRQVYGVSRWSLLAHNTSTHRDKVLERGRAAWNRLLDNHDGLKGYKLTKPGVRDIDQILELLKHMNPPLNPDGGESL